MSRVVKRVDNPDHISILTGGTRGEIAKLVPFLDSIQAMTARPDRVDVWCAIDVGDREAANNIATASVGRTFKVHTVEVSTVVANGTFCNKLREACTSNPGIWGILSDKTEIMTPGWDDLVRAEHRKYKDGIVFIHGQDTAHSPENGGFGAFGFVGAGWANVTGGLHTEYFPFWFDDVWLNDVSNMINRRVVIPFLVKYEVGTAFHLHNTLFWSNFYARLVDERVAQSLELLSVVCGGNKARALELLKSSPSRQFIRNWDVDMGAAMTKSEVRRSRRLQSENPLPAPDERVMRAEGVAVRHLSGMVERAASQKRGDWAQWLGEGLLFATNEADRLYGQAEAARQAKRFAEAVPVLNVMAKRFPNFPQTYWLGFDLMSDLGQKDHAALFLKTGLSRMPNERGLRTRV